MLDRLLEAGTVFDWISPAWAALQDAAHGGGHSFVLGMSNLTGRQVQKELRRAGVESWGLMIVGGLLLITVPKPQAAQAQAELDRLGVPIESGAVAGPTRAAQPRPGRPRALSRRTVPAYAKTKKLRDLAKFLHTTGL